MSSSKRKEKGDERKTKCESVKKNPSVFNGAHCDVTKCCNIFSSSEKTPPGLLVQPPKDTLHCVVLFVCWQSINVSR